MGKLKRVGKAIGLIAVAILLLEAVVYTGLNYSSGRKLERELKALKDFGAPLTLAEIAPPAVPDEENAALLYQKAFTLMQEGNKEERKAFKAVFKGSRINWPEADTLLIRSLLKKNEGALDLVRQATLRDKCRFPLEYEKGYGMLVPHLSKMRQPARLLAAKALLQNEEGKIEEALKTCQIGFRLGKSLLTEPILISQLVRIAINAITSQALEVILNQNEAQPTTYEALIRELDDLEGHTAFARSLETERAGGLWAFSQIRKKPSMVRALLPQDAQARLYGSYPLRPILLKMDEVYYLRMMERMIAPSRLPYYQAIAEVKDFDKELENVPRYCLLTRMILPALGRASIVQARSEARIRAGKLALALKIYKAKKGVYPQSLKSLTPAILPQLPKDPFTGKDYVYRREGEGFLVYSVGQNLKDDNGAFDPKRREEGDIPWRCER